MPNPTAPCASTPLTPLGQGEARITGGFWAERQAAVAAHGIPLGHQRLEDAKNLDNLRVLAGLREGDVIGMDFQDSDIYKWLEAAAWEYGRTGDASLPPLIDSVTHLLEQAQGDDGYLDSVVEVRHGAENRYSNLPWSHELYCAGHLMQAAVAAHRTLRHAPLLRVATRFADHLVATFGPGKLEQIDGHPVIEMALVELYRETGTRAYLDLARYFIDAHGTGIIEAHGKNAWYFSDRVPVREHTTVEGHAVRAVYLTAGATDLAIEESDPALLAHLEAQFERMVATRQYVSGGIGSRWDWEAFGDDYELPTDRGYAESCAAIGSVQWAWRLLLATGKATYADHIEHVMFNAVMPGVSLAGTEYFYVNPLQLRTGALADENRSPAHGRRGWFDCACCPPNLMRTLASLDTMAATGSDTTLDLHQYAPGSYRSAAASITVETQYPWDGTVTITVEEARDGASLRVRVPAWAGGATLTVDGTPLPAVPGVYAEARGVRAGQVLTLTLPFATRYLVAHPAIDASRGCVAVFHGPLLYALEAVDNEATLEEVSLVGGPDAAVAAYRPDLLVGVTTLTLPGRHRPAPAAPYAEEGSAAAARGEARDVSLVAVPYFAWANRDLGAMRVWIPREA
ncbi:glycoside hydrolase family 127 protein [Micrococcales bacterium 31B]|nr:glycoside hydrolase family 127 protein [Micrococcales bacterium 31B]